MQQPRETEILIEFRDRNTGLTLAAGSFSVVRLKMQMGLGVWVFLGLGASVFLFLGVFGFRCLSVFGFLCLR